MPSPMSLTESDSEAGIVSSSLADFLRDFLRDFLEEAFSKNGYKMNEN